MTCWCYHGEDHAYEGPSEPYFGVEAGDASVDCGMLDVEGVAFPCCELDFIDYLEAEGVLFIEYCVVVVLFGEFFKEVIDERSFA